MKICMRDGSIYITVKLEYVIKYFRAKNKWKKGGKKEKRGKKERKRETQF